jgi:GH24 family phage-related lysozyme (muramidase)
MRTPIIVPSVGVDFTPQPLPPQSEQQESSTQTQRPRVTRAQVAPRETSIGNRILNRSAQVTGQGETPASVATALTQIQETTQSIVDSLNQRERNQQNRTERNRRQEESNKRKKAEAMLEGSAKKIAEGFKRAFSPVQGLWDGILKFITTVILGRVLLKVLNWFSDEKNKEKVDSLFRFFNDYWPAIIGTFVLFGTSFGKFIRSTIGMILSLGRFIGKSGMAGLAKIMMSLGKKGLIGALIVGGATAGLYGASKLLEPKDDKKDTKLPPIQARSGGGRINPIKLIMPESRHVNDIKFESGGPISTDTGLAITGAGVDTQLIAARPGEIVISKEAVNKYGPKLFLNLNKSGGGTNRPKMANGIQLASGGGMVGAVNLALPHIKQEEALSSLTRGANDYVRVNQSSTISKTPWSKLTPNTPVHAYRDSGGLPTIGWGATFYDSLLSGNKKVKMGDTTTKADADKRLNFHVSDLASAYSRDVPFWNKMTTNQQAGVLLTGYHRPYSMLGAPSYSDYSAALKKGDMKGLTNAITSRKETPSQRLSLQKSLIMSGPLDLSKKQAPKENKAPTPTPKPQNLFQRATDAVMKFTGLKKAEVAPSSPNVPIPGRLNRRASTVTQLPPISMNSGVKPPLTPGSSDVPDLDAMSPLSDDLAYNARAYGLA